MVDAAVRADADLLEPQVAVGQVIQTRKSERDVI
jgi:hypothetical protein